MFPKPAHAGDSSNKLRGEMASTRYERVSVCHHFTFPSKSCCQEAEILKQRREIEHYRRIDTNKGLYWKWKQRQVVFLQTGFIG